jgi:CTP-dependent riboflavin kinase
VARPPRFGNIVLCEHVVRGEGNKSTLINVFSGDIIASKFPGTLNLGLFVEHLPYPDVPETEILLSLKLNGAVFGRVSVHVVKDSRGGPGNIVIPLFDVTVASESVLEITAKVPGTREKSILQKRILGPGT